MIAEAVTTAALAGIFYLILRAWGREESPGQERHEAKSLDVLFAEGESLLRAGRVHEAEVRFREVAAKDPSYPKLMNRLGIVYMEKGDYSRAIAWFEKAVRQDPSKAVRHVNLALAYQAAGHRRQAKESLQRAVQLAPDNKHYRRLLSEVS